MTDISKSEPVPATNQAGEVEQSDWDFAYSFTRKGHMKGSDSITVLANLVSEYRRSFVSSDAPCLETNGVGETGPCANCGSEAASIKGPDKLHPYRVVCKSCGASTAHHASWRASNDAWNRRPSLATQPATSQEGELLATLLQYIDDLRYPPTGDSIERRIAAAKQMIDQISNPSKERGR